MQQRVRRFPRLPLPRQTEPLLASVALLVLVLAVFWQVGGHDFINFDDGYLFSADSRVPQGLTREGISWAFTTFHTGYWQPLTWLSHMGAMELFGTSSGWHHRVNMLFHLLNAELLLLVLWRMTGGLWRSAFVAALFAVHPLHVESVAWVTERKDVLSALFWFLSLGAYLHYARRPGLWRYLGVLVLFALGLMAKPMLVTLPCVLLLLDFWPLGRLAPADRTGSGSWPLHGPVFAGRVLEKLPLLALSVASGLVTYLGQSAGGALVPLVRVSLGARVSTALLSYLTYLGKTVWPVSLALYSTSPADTTTGLSPGVTAGALLLLLGISVPLLRRPFDKPYLAVGWLWYLGTLVPVIGLVQAGTTLVADRFTYLPLIGVFVAIVWFVPGLLGKWHYRRLVLGTAGVVAVVALAAAARVQTGYWRDSVTLASRALAVTEKNWLASTILGLSLAQRGQFEQAVPRYEEALRLNPVHAQTWHNLGVAYARTERLPQAIVAYQTALAIDPGYAEAWNNLCAAFAQLGQFEQALASCRAALRIKSDYATALHNLEAVREAREHQSRSP